MELISDLSVTDTKDGGAIISAKVAPELVSLILQSWLRGTIFDAVEKILITEDAREPREVSTEDGSVSKASLEQNEVLQEIAARTRFYNDGPPNPSDQR